MKKIAQKNHIIIYSLLFVLILAVCRVCFWRKGLLPIYVVDGLGQYYPAFLYIGKTIREFSFSFYDLCVGMGEDVIGTLNYYGLGDPVNVIAVFATKTTGPYVFAFSYYLRLYLGGLAFMIYIKRFGLSKFSSVAAAVSYAFCGYGIYAAGMYIEYASMLFVFPLILFGCERVLHREKGRWILFASAWYLGLCGFYFTYICTVFVIVYCVVRAFFIYGRTVLSQTLGVCVQCALLFALGLCCAAPILLPSLSAFLTSARSSSLGLRQLLVLSNYIPSITRRFVSDANVMNAIRNYPVFIGAAALFFVKADKRVTQLRIAIASLFVLLYIPITAIVFNGFSDPRDRWVFEAQFVLCVAFAVALDALKRSAGMRLYRVMLILAVCSIVVSFWGRYSSLGEDRKDMYVNASTAVSETTSAVSASPVITGDGELFRVSGDFTSSVNERPINDGMNNGYFGTHYWFSVVNENTQAFVDEATGRSNDWRSFGLGSDNKYNTAAAVKYYVSKSGSAPDGFALAEDIEYGDEKPKVYVNENFRGFAWIADDPDDLSSDIAGSCSNFSYSGNDFSCEIGDDAESAAVVTAFSYAKGWKAYINGSGADTANCSGRLAIFADNLKKGDILTLKYTSPGFFPGVIIAVIALVCYMAVCFFERKSYDTSK